MAFDIKKLLQSVVTHGSSDLHLVARAEPQIRLDGRLKAVNLPILEGDDIEEMCYSLLTEKQKQEFEEFNELDFALLLPGIIPIDIPSLDQLGAPAIYKQFVKREKGLILVTVLSVEDPVEFIHLNKKCLFSHRGVGDDTASFSRALKSALRQDPDIIFIGEMRDRETIEAGLSAAETGHLVFGTLHTSSAPGTINRIIDVFSYDCLFTRGCYCPNAFA